MKLLQVRKNNKQDLLTVWVEEFSDELYSWALFKTSDKLLAEDLIQDTFLAATKSIDKFNESSSPKTWLFSILNNKIIDFYRKKKRVVFAFDSEVENRNLLTNFFDSDESWKKEHKPEKWEEDENQILDDMEFRQTLQNCLQKLPAKWMSIIELKYIEEKEGKDICQEMRISSTNYWQVIHRAKLQLRACLENNWFKYL